MKIKKHRIIFDGEYYRCQEWKLWNPFWKNIGGLTHPVQSLYQTLSAARHDLEKHIGVHSEHKIVAVLTAHKGIKPTNYENRTI